MKQFLRDYAVQVLAGLMVLIFGYLLMHGL